MHPTDLPTRAQAEYLRRGIEQVTFRSNDPGGYGTYRACWARGWIVTFSNTNHVTNEGRAALARYDATQGGSK